MNENDLRVIKTQQHIEQAFLHLLAAKPYRAITVQDILVHAQINRSTFYRHFVSKDALAEKMVANFRTLYEGFLTERFTITSQNDLASCLDQFWSFIYSQKNRILALWQIKTPDIDLYQDMYHLIKQNYITSAKRQQQQGNLDFQGHSYASLVLNNLRYCLEQEQFMTLDELRQDLQYMLQTAQLRTAQAASKPTALPPMNSGRNERS